MSIKNPEIAHDKYLNYLHQHAQPLSHHLQELREQQKHPFTGLAVRPIRNNSLDNNCKNVGTKTTVCGSSSSTCKSTYSSSSELYYVAIHNVDFLVNYLEYIIHYSWEEVDDDEKFNVSHCLNEFNNTNHLDAEKGTFPTGYTTRSNEYGHLVVASTQQVEEVLHNIVNLREYIARCVLTKYYHAGYFSSSFTPSYSPNEKYGDCDYDDDDGVVHDICERLLEWAIAAKQAGFMEECLRANLYRMSIEPIWKQLDAVRLLGVVNENVELTGEGECKDIIIEEIPNKRIFEIIFPMRVSSTLCNTTQHSLHVQKPSNCAIQAGRKVYDIFIQAGFIYRNCTRMLHNVLSQNCHYCDIDENAHESRKNNHIHSADFFFEHRHDVYHALNRTKSSIEIHEGPWSTLACLFLFGLSIERTVVSQAIGEDETVSLIEAGLLRYNPADVAYLLSEVQIYPLDTDIFEGRVNEENATSSGCAVYCMTDWGMESLRSNKTAIMTIGYDSLELLALSSGEDLFTPTSTKASRVLDLCCGCGIQGIFAAKRSAYWENPSIRTELIATDVNARALRFALANACLNRMFSSDGEECLNFKSSSMYSSIETNVYEPIHSGLQIGRFNYILCNPPFVAIPIAKNMANMVPALYSVGGGRDGMNILKRILDKCFDVLDEGMNKKLLMVTELPNIERSDILLRSFLPSAATISVAYIEDDVETTKEYVKKREHEAGFEIDYRDWTTSSNQILNRALALISITRSSKVDTNLFCFRKNSDGQTMAIGRICDDDEDQFLTRDGIDFVRTHLL